MKIGDIVYVNSTYITAEECEITDIIKDPVDAIQVHSMSNYGTFYARIENIFNTKEEALEAAKSKSEKLVRKYMNEIKTLKDLLQFPLDHCFNGDEYTDYEAMEAYKRRATELTGLVLTQ